MTTRNDRKKAAWRTRRIIYNNDGADADAPGARSGQVRSSDRGRSIHEGPSGGCKPGQTRDKCLPGK